MLKHINKAVPAILASIILVLSTHVSVVLSQSPTSTPTGEVDESVKILREKIATKVAELKDKSNKVITGYIDKLDANQGTLTIDTGGKKSSDVVFDSAVAAVFDVRSNELEELSFKDIKVGDYVVVVGSELDGKLTADVLYKDEERLVGSGSVVNVDKSDFSIELLTTTKDNLVLDIERYTKQSSLNVNTLSVVTSGFSDIETGDTIHFVVVKTQDAKKTRFSALRILTIPKEYFESEKE